MYKISNYINQNKKQKKNNNNETNGISVKEMEKD